jgi:tRNA 2-thiouridine synthesizing protein A
VELEWPAEMILDGRGWTCTWCILKSESHLKVMKPGQVLELLCTDPRIIQDLPKVLRSHGDELIQVDEHSDHFRLYLRRGLTEVSNSSEIIPFSDITEKKPQKRGGENVNSRS